MMNRNNYEYYYIEMWLMNNYSILLYVFNVYPAIFRGLPHLT